MKKAVKVGILADLEGEYNKGVMFEKLVYEINGQTFRGKDNVKFTEGGDIVIDGREIQVKYEHARICFKKRIYKKLKSNVIAWIYICSNSSNSTIYHIINISYKIK